MDGFLVAQLTRNGAWYVLDTKVNKESDEFFFFFFAEQFKIFAYSGVSGQ